MKTFLYILVMCLCASPALAEKVYKHIAPDGTVTYSDEPAEGSQEIILPKPQTFSFPKSNKTFRQIPETTEEEEEEKKSYTLNISSPENEYTVTMGQESLDVAVQVSPSLAEDHGLQLFLDGQGLGEPDRKMTFIITQLYRGTHQLQAKIVELKNPEKVIKESDPVTFYVHRASVIDN